MARYILVLGTFISLYQPLSTLLGSFWALGALLLVHGSVHFLLFLFDKYLVWPLRFDQTQKGGIDLRNASLHFFYPLAIITISALLGCSAANQTVSRGISVGLHLNILPLFKCAYDSIFECASS